MLSLDVENVRNEWFVCGVLYAKSSIKGKEKNEMLNYGLDTNEVVLKQFAFNCVEDDSFFFKGVLTTSY